MTHTQVVVVGSAHVTLTASQTRVVRVTLERRRGSAGSRLQAQLVLLFSVVAVTPAIVLAIFVSEIHRLGQNQGLSGHELSALATVETARETSLCSGHPVIGEALANEIVKELQAVDGPKNYVYPWHCAPLPVELIQQQRYLLYLGVGVPSPFLALGEDVAQAAEIGQSESSL